jgi:hypothetical protein
MWFPFFRIKTSIPGQTKSIATQERGWIYKAWGLQSVTELRKRLRKRFQGKIALPEEGKELTSDFLYCFLEKFSHWWQIQLSLQLPVEQGALWQTSPILQELKKIVENYDYDHFRGDEECFILRRGNKITKLYDLSKTACCRLEKSKVANGEDNTITIDYTPDYINMWLRGGPGGTNTLCVEDGDDH